MVDAELLLITKGILLIPLKAAKKLYAELQ